jgi:heme exporter protein A
VQLIAENLVLSRGGRTVIDGLSFRVSEGQALVLTGPNGSGKTTLLRALAGFLRPTAGGIRVASAPEEREISELLHFVGHLDGIKTHLTVEENLAFWAAYLDGGKDHRLAAALDAFALAGLADIPAGYLSAGQKRRLALARLKAAERPLWLLDEPTVSLDAAAVAMLTDAVKAHLEGGGLAVVATHAALPLEGAQEIRLGRREGAA